MKIVVLFCVLVLILEYMFAERGFHT